MLDPADNPRGERYAFVFGSEKSGASSSIAEHADLQLKIPLHNDVEPLNVSLADAIIAYLRAEIDDFLR